MKQLIIIIITSFYICSSNAQQYTGIIKDEATHEALSFVNIGVINKGVGTVSQLDGMFKIIISDSILNDTLRISMLGYKTKLLLVKNFLAQYQNDFITLYLQAEIQELDIVTVRPRNMKEVTLGNTFDSPNMRAGFKSDDLGSEIGTVMKLKNRKTYFLKTAGFNIAYCGYDSILFRVNIYNILDHKPGEVLHSLPIYVKAVEGQTKILVDLQPYNITIEEDFILSLEWIQDLPEKSTAFMFCAGFIGNRLFYKQTSQASWNSFPIGIGSWCVAEYEK